MLLGDLQTHAAATQTLQHSSARHRRYTEAGNKYRRKPQSHSPHSYSCSSARTSARSTPRHAATNTKPSSPVTLDPSHLGPGQRGLLAGRPGPELTTCSLPPCSAAPGMHIQMSVVDILHDLKNSEPKVTFTSSNGGRLDGKVGGGGRAVACPVPPAPPAKPAGRVLQGEEIGRSVGEERAAPALTDTATSPAERQDLINKIGKRIRFRRKKKEKLKTENRAKKALKTISLILGAFVT